MATEHSPSVSVVIPCYNAERYLGETLRSVLAQTYPPCEVLVVDDGSRDASVAVAEAFGNPVRVLRRPNGGDCAARNTGIEAARGDWIAFLDADDLWGPHKLERQVREVRGRDDIVLVHTGFYLFGIVNEVPPPPPAVCRGEYSLEELLINPLVNSSAAMVRAGLPVRFPEGVFQGGDTIYFAQLSAFGPFVYIPEPLAGYRLHPTQFTRDRDSWVRNLRNRFEWVRSEAARLGPEISRTLLARLREQTIEWIRLARWTRQWDRYWALREFAAGLDWEGDVPDVLRERLYPRFVYTWKDVWDRYCRATPSRAAAGGSD